MKVSIIVPVYNTERYLDRCLSTLVDQTLKDIEVIVINDGSTDGSQAIIDDYKVRYGDMIKTVVKENGGQAVARNLGIGMANGEYIAFVDSDDYIDESMMEKLYEAAASEGADIAMCGVNYVYEDGLIKERRLSAKMERKSNIFESKTLLAYASSYSCNKIYKREFFLETGIYFPDQKMEDVAIAYNILFNVKKLAFVDECLYYYRTVAGSTSNSLNDRTYDIFKACDNFLAYYKEQGVYEQFREELEYRVITHITLRFNVLLYINDGKKVDRFVDAAFSYLDGKFPQWRENRYYAEDRNSRIEAGTDGEFFYSRIDRDKLKRYLRKRRFKRGVRRALGRR